MAAVCFRKPEVVITQPWIEIYQTSAVIRPKRNKNCDAMAAVSGNRDDVITTLVWFDLVGRPTKSHAHVIGT